MERRIRARITVVKTSRGPVSGVGVTRNLGTGGVLFRSNLKIDIGDAFQYVIHLGASGEVKLHCVGRVLRVQDSVQEPEDSPKLFEIAATLERHTLHAER